jgi:hypothetical protein
MLIVISTYLRRHHVGLLALMVAMGGASYAAVNLPARSVGTPQLKNGAVTFKKIEPATRGLLQGQTGPAGAVGPAGSAGPPGPAGTTGQDVTTVYGTAQLVVTSATAVYTLVPGLTQTITVPSAARVLVSTDGGAQNTTVGVTNAVLDLALFVDGQISSSAGQRRLMLVNSTAAAQVIGSWSMSRSYSLAPGSHLIEVRVTSADPASVPANVSSGGAPQLQGQLTVAVIKQ